MPELAEVKTVIKALKSKILNKEIANIQIYKEKLFKEKPIKEFKEALINQKILNIENKGKHIIIFLTNNVVLLSHLRMEGKYRFYETPFENERHLIVKFIFKDNTELHYLDSRMFGTFHLRNIFNYNQILPLSKVANEPNQLDIKEFYNKIKTSSTAIKTKLLDQELVAGIGNIYADEALFASKVHPCSSCRNLSFKKVKEIILSAGLIMDESFKKGGTTLFSYESINNQEGEFQNFLKIHNNKIKNCVECKGPIIKIKVNQRGTYICERCQKKY
ncbi:DNA-formamidopyrimidine glycosylase [[Mycoplasma] anseris]|uniref:DNA-formamidopyrimidine glycosylase n=1 Tax=[Mycoplasma] anseris TaxID=92400 RepID=A0A2Z4ND32_9BACT|nr:DNA-formamidopyrimidine glycosylase [[Mycoplasma] anseris]AWX69459.1 DNA-formamidopyrimidine glycosylase [[Mycoplasma] anseris]